MQLERLFDIVDHQRAHFPQAACVGSLEEGVLRNYSTQEYITTAESLALGLMDLGVVPGDKVALVSGNRAEWSIVDQALLRIGAISIPIYPTSSAEDYAYVLGHSGAKVFFVSNAELLEKAQAANALTPTLQHIFTFERIAGTPHWKELLGRGAERIATLEGYKAQVKRKDLATIIYT
ncbi:MAG: AMP-binding protein, partial [Flavobacteriales bacterium]|nr:AMP-binding protein [Flavobacteriales bacterium]